MTKKKKSALTLLFEGSILLVIANVTTKAINFFLLPLYTHHLTPEMMGISDTVSSLTAVLHPLLVLGLDSAYGAFYFDKEDNNRENTVFSTLSVALFVMGAIPLVISLFSASIANLFFGSNDYSALVKIAMASISLSIWGVPLSLELRMQNRMGAYSLSYIVASASLLILNVFFLSVLELGEYSIVLGTMGSYFLQLILLLILVKKRLRFCFIKTDLLKRVLRFSLPLVPTAVMSWILTSSDRYVLLYYHGEQSVGIYSISVSFVSIINVVVTVINSTYCPFAYGIKDNDDAQDQFKFAFSIFSLSMLFIAFSVSLFGKEIIQLMTDSAYDSAYVSLRDLVFAQAIYGIGIMLGYGSLFAKKSYVSLCGVSAGAIVNLSLNIILIPRYGISAAAATTLAGFAVNALIQYTASQHYYPCDYGLRKILLVLALVYTPCIIFQESILLIKALIWFACICVVVLIYRNLIGNAICLCFDYIRGISGDKQ